MSDHVMNLKSLSYLKALSTFMIFVMFCSALAAADEPKDFLTSSVNPSKNRPLSSY